LSVGGAEVEGAVFPTFFDKDMVTTTEASKFLSEFEKKNPGVEPAAITALGYDAYILILDAITRANSSDGTAIRDALASTSNFQAVTGSTTLDANGDAVKDAVIKVVKDGKFSYLDYVKAQ
jgi:branched-chain amino acid transport system substrate-binding protein